MINPSLEVFKVIPLFPDYEVSNFGRVRTLAREIRYVHAVTKQEHFRQTTCRYLKIQMSAYGYKFHQLYKDKKMHNVMVHRLVAITFLERKDGLDVVNHKDGNKHNNTVENLEWCTDAYNHKHATETGLKPFGERVGSSKLNDRMIYAIKYLNEMGISHGNIAKAFQVSRSNITLICLGRTWKKSKNTKSFNLNK